MKLKLYTLISIILSISLIHTAKQPMPATSKTESKIPTAPYSKELIDAKIPQTIIQGWQQLYEQCIQANTPNAKLSTQTNPLFSMNFYTMIADYLNPKTFPPFTNDPESQVHFNYATVHLRDAALRLASTTTITESNNTPTVTFTGDCRDMGIIVNIQNNTNAQFSINQKSIDGKSTTQIGLISQGFNAVNLHTAALQDVTKLNNGKQSNITKSSTSIFEFQELNAQNPTFIKLAMMSGAELITFLESLPRKNKNIIEMNGLPTSPEFIASPTDWYFVLIQNPTPTSSTIRNPDQRIQAINVSTFSGPYLLTMQINPFTIELKSNSNNLTLDVFQSSIIYVHTITDQTIITKKFPLIILPQFLWNLPKLQALWVLQTTSFIMVVTNFKLFDIKVFSNAYQYFSHLGFFENRNNHAFFIDLYNRIAPNYILYNAPWLRSNALYETDLTWCTDIPQIYTSQDPYGHILVNENNFYYINFLAIFRPNVPNFNSEILFQEKGFNASFASPLNQLYSFIVNSLLSDIKEGIFGTVTQIRPEVYTLKWTNKKNQILSSQTLYLNNPLSNIEITFLNQATDWVGSAVPTPLIQFDITNTNHFKVTYEYSPANNKHILLAQPTSPIDKQEVFLPLHFSEYPIQNLYIDLFQTFNVQPYTRCFIFKNGIVPPELANLTAQDWQSGIYMVPRINKKTNLNNSSQFEALFYKSDKTYLGSIPTDIPESISAYNIHFSKFNGLMHLYLSTGVMLKYTNTL